MRLALLLLAATIFGLCDSPYSAAEVNTKALEGRWTNGRNCGDWIQFRQQGSDWVYRERRFDQGTAYPASVSANPDGSIKLGVKGPDFAYEYAIKFVSNNSFQSVEGFTAPPQMAGQKLSFTYTRCP